MNETQFDFMRLALKEAKESYDRGDFPVGAILTYEDDDGTGLIGRANNRSRSNENWDSHAEAILINSYGTMIQNFKLVESRKIILYTTLEPCLGCLGKSVMNRIDKIIYACPDPNAGATSLNVKSLPGWYQRHWPEIEGNLFREESYNLLVNHMSKNKTWSKVLKLFEEMNAQWN